MGEDIIDMELKNSDDWVVDPNPKVPTSWHHQYQKAYEEQMRVPMGSDPWVAPAGTDRGKINWWETKIEGNQEVISGNSNVSIGNVAIGNVAFGHKCLLDTTVIKDNEKLEIKPEGSKMFHSFDGIYEIEGVRITKEAIQDVFHPTPSHAFRFERIENSGEPMITITRTETAAYDRYELSGDGQGLLGYFTRNHEECFTHIHSHDMIPMQKQMHELLTRQQEAFMQIPTKIDKSKNKAETALLAEAKNEIIKLRKENTEMKKSFEAKIKENENALIFKAAEFRDKIIEQHVSKDGVLLSETTDDLKEDGLFMG